MSAAARPNRRLPLLLLVLAGCAVAVGWDRWHAAAPPEVAAAVERPRAAAVAAPARSAAPPAVAPLRPRDGWDAAGGDAFVAVAPPAPPPARVENLPPAEPPRVVAPPLPFTVVGRKRERDRWEVYLMRGEQVYVATVGATVGESYRVDAIGPTEIQLTYLPLNERQTLPTGTSFDD